MWNVFVVVIRFWVFFFLFFLGIVGGVKALLINAGSKFSFFFLFLFSFFFFFCCFCFNSFYLSWCLIVRDKVYRSLVDSSETSHGHVTSARSIYLYFTHTLSHTFPTGNSCSGHILIVGVDIGVPVNLNNTWQRWQASGRGEDDGQWCYYWRCNWRWRQL